MTNKDLLHIIAQKFKVKNGYGISRTKLIKLAYLAEVFYKRQVGDRLTESKWVFWKYGPYLIEYPAILNSDAFVITTTDDDFQPVKPAEEYSPLFTGIDEELAISKAMEFADDDLNDLLDFVYFDTEPMMHVSQRGEELNFDCVKPEEAYKIVKYSVSERVKQDIRKKIRKWRERRSE